MPALVRNIALEQGATFYLSFGWREDDGNGNPTDVPIPLTGAVVKMQIRKRQGEQVLLEASSETSEITVDGPNGNVSVVLPASKTMQVTSKSCRYDLWAYFSQDDRHKLLKGSVTVDPATTQASGDPVVGS